MIILNSFKEVSFDPRFALNVDKFDKNTDKIAVDKNAMLVGCIEAGKFQLFNVKKEFIWDLKGNFLRFIFMPKDARIWLVKKTDEANCELLVYDYERNLIAKEEFGEVISADALVVMAPVGEAVAVEFDYGMDGSGGFLAQLENGEIKILPYGENIFLSVLGGERALLMDNSENVAVIARISDLKRLREINFDETQLARASDGDFLLNGIIPLSDEIWLVTSVSFTKGYRHYVFDVANLRFIDEVAIEGFLPYPQKWGYERSDVTALKLADGKIAAYWDKITKNAAKKDESVEARSRYFTADFASVKAQILAAAKGKVSDER